ncbi:MAG: hypothetical protein HYT97_04155 [Elusimicrobia bacterium]|nr:hypothetical protein [Elusimicrobiota bacterium]
MTFGILSATFWEVKKFILKMGLKKDGQNSYFLKQGKELLILKISGIGLKNAQKTMKELLSDAPEIVFSTGFAGSLKKEIRAGDLVLDIEKSDPQSVPAIIQSAGDLKFPIHLGKFLTHPELLLDKEKKIKVGEATNALAIEMESNAIFQVCHEKKIAFCSLRAISDELDQDLPSFITSLNSNGKIGWGFWKAFLTSPKEWGKFFNLICSARKAEDHLSQILIHSIAQIRREKIC